MVDGRAAQHDAAASEGALAMTRLEPFVLDELSPPQQVLIKTNGTVTHILEAYTGESIKIVKLSQGYVTWDRADPRLDLDSGCQVLQRTVLLQGSQSGRNHLYADSIMIPDRLDQHVVDGLLNTDTPVGTLLVERRVETFREILAVGKEPADSCAPLFGIPPDEEMICRTYQVLTGRRPIMLITEKFPASFYVSLI